MTALVGLVFALDLLWSLLKGPTGSIAYLLIDEPLHLVTCAVAIISVAALAGSWPAARFVVAALVTSVAIDVDHLPGYLGSHLLAGSLPRPYTHGLLLVAALVALGLASRRREIRELSFGIAFGISAHLLRDLATGPGVPLVWPISGGTVRLPYAVFAGSLALPVLAVSAVREPAGARRRLGLATMLVTMAVAAALAAIPSSAAATSVVSVGAFIPGGDSNPSLIDDMARSIGRQPAMIVSYKDWSQAPFVRDQLDGIWNHGAVPMITWEPWTSSGDGISLRRVARGKYDGYVEDAARAAAAWNRPLMVRFAQEMNGPWFPWSGSPSAYRAAWRHIVRVFRRSGADRVRWVWTPYANSGGHRPFSRYFPGGRWVDWVGLDGINWGGAFPWRSFIQIFGASYRELVRLTSKPIVLAETGSGEQGGNESSLGLVDASAQHPSYDPHQGNFLLER